MKRFLQTSAIAAGLLMFAALGLAQFGPGSAPGLQTPGFNGSAGMKGNRNGSGDGAGLQGQRPRDGARPGASSGRHGGGANCDRSGQQGRSSQGSGPMGRGGGRR